MLIRVENLNYVNKFRVTDCLINMVFIISRAMKKSTNFRYNIRLCIRVNIRSCNFRRCDGSDRLVNNGHIFYCIQLPLSHTYKSLIKVYEY